jgi:hypothetical protein
MGAASLLSHAGIPFAYWPLAMPCYCFAQHVAIVDGTSPYCQRFGDNFDQSNMFPFGAEVRFAPSKITGDPTLHFDTTTQPSIFIGYGADSRCVGWCVFRRSYEGVFENMHYHTGRTKVASKVAVLQMVKDVQRVDATKDVKFNFPLREHYDEAFNTPEGWLDSSWRDNPTVHLAAMSDENPANKHDEDVPVADVNASAQISQDSSQITRAVVVPSGDGLVTIRPAIVTTTAPPDDVQDAEVESDELLALEAMCNLHEYAYEEWATKVPLGRIGEWEDGTRKGEGLPMELVVARTFLDMTNVMIVSIGGREQYRVP